MNKKIAWIIIILAVLALVLGGYYFFKQNSAAPQTTPTPSPSNQIVVGDKDEHGCIGSAGYSWCEPKSKCLRVWEEACYSSPEQEIQYALAKKYNKSAGDVSVKAINKSEKYMSGSVSFTAQNLPSPGEGGLFLAAKEGNIWTLVYDGNGSIDCQSIKANYSFPAEMLKNFCD